MTTAEKRTAWQLVRHVAVLAVRLEIAIWQSLYRFLLRRPRVPAGAVPFTYHRVVLPVIITFIVVSAIEVVAIDLLVQRWPLVRIPLLVLGIWGLTWMFGYLAAMVTRPHGVGPDGISVRYLAEIDALVTWEAIGRVVRQSQPRADKAPRLVRDDDGAGTLQLWMHDQTNVDIHLERPVVVRMPDGAEEVRTIRLFADDATGFLAEVRRHAPSVTGPAGKAPRST
ncbi:hypothetical protein [Blastococcus saxobsidens]|uniref:PH domain-containing protein n=1 Tax=Blastococcus saxobsidens (strain DD2) TaxID=1146883 RepID=H6RKB2_BLASD|nr:hypothetical protein [Blastococcus saxobsidens]CCG01135.1 conserved membrane protein of unknown function [Blastococcus saxobsidens DD2]